MKRTRKVIGEFILIVVGILVAFMIDNAVEERNDDQLREEYLMRIQDDLKYDKQAIQYRIEFFDDVRDFGLQLLNWLESDRPIDQEILLASYYAAEIWPFEPRAITYEDLKSTGNIRLFESIEFRGRLANYYMKAAASAPYIHLPTDFREMMRGTIPNELQFQIANRCPTADSKDEKPLGFPPCTLQNVNYDQLTNLFEPLKRDERFRRILNYRISGLRTKIYLLSVQSEFADDVLEHFESQSR